MSDKYYESAFPVPEGSRRETGMTLRDYFAAKAPTAPQKYIENQYHFDKTRNPYNEPHKPNLRSELEIQCDYSYEWADAMLKARYK